MNRTLLALTLLSVAALSAAGGYTLARLTRGAPDAGGGAPAPETAPTVYTCSMHPQVRLDRPGTCPICEMPLIPASQAQGGAEGRAVLELSEHAMAMASVETTLVSRRLLARELSAVGKIQYDESSLATVTARVDGYAERLFVNFTGVEIKAGDHLAEVYSPELLVAQQELLIALAGSAGGEQGSLAATSRLKLRRLGLTEEQIQALVDERSIAERVTLHSPISGTVIEKPIVQNSAFAAGDVLYRVANLDTVWVYLDIYEYDLAWVRYGQRVELAAEALPGRAFAGMVTFVQPLVDEETRTVRVPVHVANPDHALKPGMFVSARIQSSLASDGQAAATGVEGKFTCPMHPQILQDHPGDCALCEMPLERIPGQETAPDPAEAQAGAAPSAHRCPMRCEGETTYPAPGNCPVCHMRLEPDTARPAGPGVLAVPLTAVLDSGTRRLVYVEHARGLFEPREVVTGPRTGEYVPILAGLAEGEHVVTRGGFLIDSQFQITGQPSLFYPGGLLAGSGAHARAHAASAETSPAPAAPETHEH